MGKVRTYTAAVRKTQAVPGITQPVFRDCGRQRTSGRTAEERHLLDRVGPLHSSSAAMVPVQDEASQHSNKEGVGIHERPLPTEEPWETERAFSLRMWLLVGLTALQSISPYPEDKDPRTHVNYFLKRMQR